MSLVKGLFYISLGWLACALQVTGEVRKAAGLLLPSVQEQASE